MTKTKLMGISIAAIFAIGIIASPIGVDAAGSYLDVKKAKITIDDDDEFEEAKIKTKAKVLEENAYGYGIISGAGLEAIAVTTTHGGVLDSEAQSDASDASFHNHYVALQDSQADGTGLCPTLEVRDITWEEPGEVEIKGKKAVMEEVPFSFSGSHSLTGADINFNADGAVQAVVSFTITPVFNGAGGIDAVCIDVVDAADKLKIITDDD